MSLDLPDPRKPRRHLRLFLGAVACGLAAGAVHFWTADLLVWRIQRAAAEDLRRGAISQALAALDRAAGWRPENARTQLLRAACLRRLGQPDALAEALAQAERLGGAKDWIERERKLGLIQSGEFYAGAELEFGSLVEQGAVPGDVGVALVSGYLVREDAAKVRTVLEAWAVSYPGDADGAYMAGLFQRWLDEPRRAQQQFQQAIVAEPRHELARLALAQELEKEQRLAEALGQYRELQRLAPASVEALLGCARGERAQGRLQEARAALEVFSRADLPRPVAAQLAEIEWESGDYDAARRRLQTAASPSEEDATMVWTAALACSLSGRSLPAQAMTDWLDSTASEATARFDRRLRQLRSAGGPQAASLLDLPPTKPLPLAELLGDGSGPPRDVAPDSLATALYQQHCAACHGARGDGQGRAARHLFPPPRDFRGEPFRLVSTTNGVATLEDVQQAIRQGMPGTSMPAYRDLPEEHVRQLAELTLRMHREGMREQVTRRLAADGEPVDEREVAEIVRHRTTPGDLIRTPELGAANPESVRRGRDVYVQAGCLACHGEDGTGATDVTLQDDTRQAARPRDLVHQPLKGGPELASLYLRIMAGMPGTPHPAAPSLSPEQAADLVHYCRWLVQDPPVPQTNYQRQLLTDDPWN